MSSGLHLRASIGVAIAGVLWGLFWLPVRYVEAAGLSGIAPAVLFFAASVVLIAPWSALSLVRDRNRAARTLALGLLTGGAFSSYILALLYTEVVRAVLLFYLTPVWSTLLARFVLGVPISRMRLVVLLAGFGGLAVILGTDEGIPLPRNVGDWMALASGIAWAVGSLILFRGVNSTASEQTLAFSLGGLVFAFAVAAFLPAPPVHEGPVDWLPGLAVGIALAAVMLPANLGVLWASTHLEPARVGILLMSEVVVGVVSAAMLAGEPFSWREATGAALIVLAGVMEVSQRGSESPGAH